MPLPKLKIQISEHQSEIPNFGLDNQRPQEWWGMGGLRISARCRALIEMGHSKVHLRPHEVYKSLSTSLLSLGSINHQRNG